MHLHRYSITDDIRSLIVERVYLVGTELKVLYVTHIAIEFYDRAYAFSKKNDLHTCYPAGLGMIHDKLIPMT